MITVLILSACLIDTPGTCKKFEIPFYEEMSEIQCTMMSTMVVNKWKLDHSNWDLKTWKCITRQQDMNGSAIKEQGI